MVVTDEQLGYIYVTFLLAILALMIVCAIVAMIRKSYVRGRMIKTMREGCVGCYHLHLDKTDKPYCDLQWGGWCNPSDRKYYYDSDY